MPPHPASTLKIVFGNKPQCNTEKNWKTMVAHASTANTYEVEAGGSKFKYIVGYIE